VGAGSGKQSSPSVKTLFKVPFNIRGEPSVSGDVIPVYCIADETSIRVCDIGLIEGNYRDVHCLIGLGKKR